MSSKDLDGGFFVFCLFLWLFCLVFVFFFCFCFFLVWFDLVLSSSQALWLEQEQDLTLQGENSLLVLKLK